MSESNAVQPQAGTDDRRTRRQTYMYLDSHGLRRQINMALMVRRALDRGVTVTPEKRRKVLLSYCGRSAWFTGSRSSINARLAVRCADNKDITSSLLRAHGFNAPENHVFGATDLRRAWAWAEPIAPVVVKPASGQEGRLVHVVLSGFSEFASAFTAVGAEDGRVLVEEAVSGADRRVTVVDGRVVAATRRYPAHVVGDGSTTVAGLVEQKNVQRRLSANPVHKSLHLGEVELRSLRAQGKTTHTIPADAEIVHLRRAANVATGGDAVDATDDLAPEEVDYVERAVRSIPDLRFCGIDLLTDLEAGLDPWILEVNSNPSVSPHHYPWGGQPGDVISALLEAMLPDLREQPPPSPVW